MIDAPDMNGKEKEADKLGSRKLWLSIGPLFFVLLVASVFCFLVGKTDPQSLDWHGRLSTAQWVDVAKWSSTLVIAYIAGNVVQGGIGVIAKAIEGKKDA